MSFQTNKYQVIKKAISYELANFIFNYFLLKKDAVHHMYSNNYVAERLMNKLRDNSIEFRRGSAGGGNQVRQPYIRNYVKKDYHLEFPNTEHIHFYGFYIGNFPTMSLNEVDEICEVLNEV